jgi:hypothetical protein
MPVEEESEAKQNRANDDVADDAESDPSLASSQYAITSCGADFDVAGVVERITATAF